MKKRQGGGLRALPFAFFAFFAVGKPLSGWAFDKPETPDCCSLPLHTDS